MPKTRKITVIEAMERVGLRGDGALLVSACAANTVGLGLRPKGALSYEEFDRQEGAVTVDREIIFYCDSPGERASIGRAQCFERHGYRNVKVLDGGIAAWIEAGLPTEKEGKH
ncbi:MAG: rhodanese-like domain-containing protein [Acidobacteriota bacterium]